MATPLFDPLVLRLWQLAESAARSLHEVHVIHAREAPRRTSKGQEFTSRHAVPTTVVCLAGVVRLSTAAGDLDLRPGSLAVLAPAAWHNHAPLRPGAAMYTQGLIFGKSDLFFMTEEQHICALIPSQPSARLLGELLAEDETSLRLALGRDLLREAVSSPPEVAQVPPATWRMARRMWRNLDQPVRAEQVLAASGVGQRQALRLFTATFGCGPKQAIRSQQLALAAALLDEGLPLDQVIAETGFPDRRSFNRAWRQAHGQQPPTT